MWEEILSGHDMNEPIYINERRSLNPREYVKQFNFGGRSQEKMIGFLSGGERNRVHLAKSLREGCNVLLLDEPSNDLDVDTVRKLEECMETFRGVAMVISHDRYFLDRVCTHLIAFESSVADGVHDTKVQWFEGNYTEYLAFKKTQKSLRKKEQKKRERVDDGRDPDVNGADGHSPNGGHLNAVNGAADGHRNGDGTRGHHGHCEQGDADHVADSDQVHVVRVDGELSEYQS